MDKESLVRICKSAFSGEDIVEAKDLLFGCTSRAKVTRRGQGKEPRDLEDMICLFNAMTGSKRLPTFVARELHKLPPTTFDHVDVTRLLRDIVAVQADLRQIQEKYAADITQYVTISDFEQLKAELDLLKVSSVPPGVKTGNNAPFVNMHRGAFCAGDSWEQVCDSGPTTTYRRKQVIDSRIVCDKAGKSGSCGGGARAAVPVLRTDGAACACLTHTIT
ncbi:hypothetical protein JYU34_010006 [Plutella xylostella]|uniref:Mutant cadherin n=1 Tax=Plutella xylostella TaxID=51655 RepID=A0ABQ7QHG8_PLUXY|nr:hypothetical protein JYU34_010006 [Plutella xylostella]